MTKTMDSAAILAAFERRADGTWLCREPAVILAPDGALRIEPGRVFAFGERLGGLDVAEFLEQLGAQFGS